jgi:hypothetical protein
VLSSLKRLKWKNMARRKLRMNRPRAKSHKPRPYIRDLGDRLANIFRPPLLTERERNKGLFQESNRNREDNEKESRKPTYQTLDHTLLHAS